MRIALFAYSSTGAQVLRTLLGMGRNVVGVFTHADQPGECLWFDSVARIAEASGIPVHTVSSKNPAGDVPYRRALESLRPDLVLSASFRALIPVEVLSIAPEGGLNFHPSLLPRYRGRAPVNWVLVNGETETGMTLHHMVAKPDAGDMVGQVRLPIGPDETAPELQHRMDAAAATLLEEFLPRIEDGTAPRVPQDPSQSSYFGRRGPQDGRFEWTWSARRIHNLVRAVTRPYPGAFVDEPGGTRLFVWRTRLVPGGSGSPLKPEELPPPGSPEGCVVGTGDGCLELLDTERVAGQ